MEILKIIEFNNNKYENLENHRIQTKNNENHENFKIPRERIIN